MTISSEAVTAAFMDCLFTDGEDTTNHVVAEGIVQTVGFHPDRLASHRDEVMAMLMELPVEFRQTGGGGWSFLNACMDKDGAQWTGLHQVMEQLFCMGIALGLCEYQIPREMWDVLPGGMPYIVIKDKT